MAGDDPTVAGILKNIGWMFFLCSICSKKSQATNRAREGRSLPRKVKAIGKTLANKTRNLDAEHPHFLEVFT
jgi:hypothetical protein